eukprot:g6403.t1
MRETTRLSHLNGFNDKEKIVPSHLGTVVVPQLLLFVISNLVGNTPTEQAFWASIVLVALSRLLCQWPLTSSAGRVIENRVLCSFYNWQNHTMRSMVEMSSFIALVALSRTFCRHFGLPNVATIVLGGIGGLFVCIIGEFSLKALDSHRAKQRTANVSSRLARGGNRGGVVFQSVLEQEKVEKEKKLAAGKAFTTTKVENNDDNMGGLINRNVKMLWREEEGKAVWTKSVFYRKNKVEQAKKFLKSRNGRKITMAEVAKHNSRADAWLCIEGRAYDVSKYVEHHPGGWLPISNLAGKDVTDAFANYHPAHVYEKLLPQYYIGEISDYKESEFAKEHRAIRQTLLRKGLFETKPSYYVMLACWLTLLLASSVYCTVVCEGYTSSMIGALLLGFFWQQSAFVGHDLGHNSISHKRDIDLWIGLCLLNTSGGIGLNWWKRSHNVHHVVCNSIENDPDIQHLPAFAVSNKIFDDTNKGTWWSSYHRKQMIFDPIARFLVSYQHYLFYPIMAVARVNLYIQSYLLLFDFKEKVSYRKSAILSLLFFKSWMLSLVYYAGENWKERVLFFLVSHAVAGLLHVQICISHFAMDTYHGRAYNDETDEWFRMQVKTTMNVNCSKAMDWFHGGLQFQIEHHLWPRLPRHNLRYARDLTKKLCEKYDIHYHEPDFFQANVELIKCLRSVAMDARKAKKGDAGFWQSQLREGLYAEG